MGKCEDCKWWDFQCPKEQPGSVYDSGWCRRNAPLASNVKGEPHHADNAVNAIWPWTDSVDWCGEFREKSIKEHEELTKKPIEYLEFSARTENALYHSGKQHPTIRTIGELLICSKRDLLSRRNFGLTSLREVKRKLADIDLSLRT